MRIPGCERSDVRMWFGLGCASILALRALSVTAAAPATAAAPRGFVRVSVATNGTQANGSSSQPAISPDGRFVAFVSEATNLVAGDINGVADVFVHDRSTGVTTRESVATDGTQANGRSSQPALSADGRYLAFLSAATNLVPGTSANQVYVRDRQVRVTAIASISAGGLPASTGANSPVISADGRFVAFESRAANLVPGSQYEIPGVFTHDMSTGSTTRDTPDNQSYEPSISADGRYVSYYSAYLPGYPVVDTVFVRDRLTGQATLESYGPTGALLDPYRPRMSADGRFILFLAYVSNKSHLFVRDRQGGQTADILEASVDAHTLSPDGRFASYTRGYGNAAYVEALDLASRRLITVAPGHNSSRNAIGGNTIAFQSDAALVSDDANGAPDIYVAPVAADAGAPDPPANLTFTLVGSTLTLTWQPSAGTYPVAEYAIEAGSVSFSANVANFSIGAGTSRFSAALNSLDTAYIRVRAANAAGVSLPSNEIVVNPRALPGAPGALTGAAAGTTVALSWTQPTASPILNYVIEAGSAPTRIDVAYFNTGSTATTFVATGLQLGTYFVRVRATSVSGPGAPSNEVKIVVGSACSPPGPPSGLTRSVAGSSATLSWTAGLDAFSYVLEAGSAPGASDVAVTELRSPATSITLNDVPAGTYFVRLRSRNPCGQSGVSNETIVTVTGPR